MKILDVDSKEFKKDYILLYEGAFRKMMMRDCHSKQQCIDFYEREGIQFIRYEGKKDGYHKFKEFYSAAIRKLINV
jgi:hypothetical protein